MSIQPSKVYQPSQSSPVNPTQAIHRATHVVQTFSATYEAISIRDAVFRVLHHLLRDTLDHFRLRHDHGTLDQSNLVVKFISIAHDGLKCLEEYMTWGRFAKLIQESRMRQRVHVYESHLRFLMDLQRLENNSRMEQWYQRTEESLRTLQHRLDRRLERGGAAPKRGQSVIQDITRRTLQRISSFDILH